MEALSAKRRALKAKVTRLENVVSSLDTKNVSAIQIHKDKVQLLFREQNQLLDDVSLVFDDRTFQSEEEELANMMLD